MSRTSKALKRLGVAGVAVATIGAGVPAFFATAAQAANPATAISLSPDTRQDPAGTCAQYTVQVTAATPGDTTTVDVTATPRAANQDVAFCTLNSAGTSYTTPAGGNAGIAGQSEHIEIVTDNTGKATFGVTEPTAGVVDVTAFVEDPAAADNQPNGTEPKDTSVQTFIAGGADQAASVDASPEDGTAVQANAYSFTAVVKNSAGQPLVGVQPYYDVTAGPDSAVGPTACGTTDQTGTATCTLAAANAGTSPGTDTILVYVNQSDADNNPATIPTNAYDTGEPSDSIQVTFQAPQAAGTTVTLTCADHATNTTSTQCQNPLSDGTEVFNALVKNSAGTPVAGVAVSFAITNGQNTDVATPTQPDSESLSASSCLTDASGKCSVTLTDTNPTANEALTVTATIGTANGTTNQSSATLTFRNPGGAEARNITLTPETATAKIGDVVQLTAKVTDRLGNPVQFVEVTFTESGTGRFTNGASTFTVLTDATGSAKAELTTTSAEAPGTETVTATITGYATNANYAGYTQRGAGTADDECEQPAGTTTAPNATPGANNVPGTTAGNCADTSTITYTTTGSPSPSPTGTGTPGAKPVLSTSTPDIQPNQQGKLTATGVTANAVYELRCYSRPSTTYFTARTVTAGATDTSVSFTILPGTNTRCYVRPQGDEANASNSVVINVHTTLSLSAYRDGVRQYHFQGTNLPRRSGQLITLYRWARADNNGYCDPHVAANDYTATSTDPNCVAIRTATATTDSSNVWRIDRTFTGSGQFVFMAKTSQNLTNAAGVSNLRLTIIH